MMADWPTEPLLQQHGRRTTRGHSVATNGAGDGYDFVEGSEAEEMDPEQLAALKEEVGGPRLPVHRPEAVSVRWGYEGS